TETLCARFGSAWAVMPSRAQALPGSWKSLVGKERLYASVPEDLACFDSTKPCPGTIEDNHNQGPPFPRGSL
ncbi:MAG: hypothetical protein KC492_36945, partial [Myxococcales bacterium]|nr:hypothetical protein [Myxococcales bacterium]